MIDFASSYCILFCCVWLLSLRTRFISNERQKGSGSGGREGGEEMRRVEGKSKLSSGNIVRERNVFSINGKKGLFFKCQ